MMVKNVAIETQVRKWKKLLQPPNDIERLKSEGVQLLAKLPHEIDAAIEGAHPFVMVFDLDDRDIALKHQQYLEAFYKNERILNESDLVERGLMVFNWCSEHGLECFIKADHVAYAGDLYHFCIRPK